VKHKTIYNQQIAR